MQEEVFKRLDLKVGLFARDSVLPLFTPSRGSNRGYVGAILR